MARKTRLTKEMKQDFIDKVHDRISATEEAEALRDAISRYAVNLLPEPVHNVWVNHKDLRSYIQTASASLYDSLSGANQWKLEDPDVDGTGESMYITVPHYNRFGSGGTECPLHPARMLENTEIAAAHKAWRAKLIAKYKVKRELIAVVSVCKTVEDLKAALPELESLVPEPAVPETKLLPACTGLVVNLTALGVIPLDK